MGKEKERLEIIKILIEEGADVNKEVRVSIVVVSGSSIPINTIARRRAHARPMTLGLPRVHTPALCVHAWMGRRRAPPD